MNEIPNSENLDAAKCLIAQTSAATGEQRAHAPTRIRQLGYNGVCCPAMPESRQDCSLLYLRAE